MRLLPALPVPLALLVLAGLVAGCRTRIPSTAPRDTYAGVAFSALPQVGLEAGGGKIIARPARYDLAAEGAVAFQFIDDTDLADDGRPGPGSFTQLRGGLKHTFSPGGRRHLTARYGLVWFRATGANPLIIDDPGDYLGIYAGVGFETDLTPTLTMGPEIRLLIVDGLDGQGVQAFPQFAWNLFWNF